MELKQFLLRKMKKEIKYVIREKVFNNINIEVYENIDEWKKNIDNKAINSCNNGTFLVEIFEFENSNKKIQFQKVKIHGTQGRRDSYAYIDSIPKEWGKPIYQEKIEYFQIYEDEEGKYYISGDCGTDLYDSEEELINIESPSQYITFN